MFRRVSYLLICMLAVYACDTEFKNTVLSQEQAIDSYIESKFKDYEVVRGGCSVRVIIEEGIGNGISKGDSVLFLYSGALMTNSGPGMEFTCDTASAVVGRGKLLKGLDEGLTGARLGETSQIFFTAENGFGKSQMGLVPESSALCFTVYISDIKRNN